MSGHVTSPVMSWLGPFLTLFSSKFRNSLMVHCDSRNNVGIEAKRENFDIENPVFLIFYLQALVYMSHCSNDTRGHF